MISASRLLFPAILATSLALPAGALAQSTDQGTAPPQTYDNQAPRPGTSSANQPKPKGGCLKYGAVGAVGGHVAHHHAVLGAMGGCAAGMYVKHRSKKHIRETGQP